MIGFAEQQSWRHISRDKREVGTVVAIEHLLGTGGTHHSHKRVVMIGMTAIEPVGHTVDLVLRDDIGEIDMSVVDGDTEIQHGIHTSPVAQTDGHAIGILRVETLDVFGILLNSRTQFLLIGSILHRDTVEIGLQVSSHITIITVACAGEPVVVGLSLSISTASTTLALQLLGF